MLRLLANENFPGVAITALRERGHDIAWIRQDSPGSTDTDVLARAVREERILITFDKDFGELAFRSRLPAFCGVVLFRIAPISPSYVVGAVLSVLSSRDDWQGHFAVVEEHRLRIRPMPE